MIPKILHQTFSARRPLAPELERLIERHRALNPDWEYRYYDDQTAEEVVEAQLGTSFIDTFRRIDTSYGAAKADVFRYACIFAYGGMYLDIKSACTRSISECIRSDDECVLSYWDSAGYPGWGTHGELKSFGSEEFQQWFLLASPKHPLIEQAMMRAKENLERYSFFRDGIGRTAVLRVTGPIAFTKAIYPFLNQSNHRIVSSANDLHLVYDAFENAPARMSVVPDNYRRSTRPLMIPRIVPTRFYRAYFEIWDTFSSLLRDITPNHLKNLLQSGFYRG